MFECYFDNVLDYYFQWQVVFVQSYCVGFGKIMGDELGVEVIFQCGQWVMQ